MRATLASAIALLALAAPAYAEEPALHADLKAAYDDDSLELIIKATSAVAMTKACPAEVRLAEKYAGSVAFLLDANDERFGAGTSAVDIARKIKEHEDEKDCAPLATGHRMGAYKNIFLDSSK